jgi:two-component system NtrC family response regulator
LRDRAGDIPLLIRYFSVKHGGEKVVFHSDATTCMQNYLWPGNVRELENTVERLLIMRNSEEISVEDLPDKIRGVDTGTKSQSIVMLPDEGYSLEQLEREIVVLSLERNGWNQTAAARFLRIPRHTLIYRMEKYGISQHGVQ